MLRAARSLYRAALQEDDAVRRSRVVSLDQKRQLEAWQRLRALSAQTNLQNPRAIADGPFSSEDWLDGDKPERRSALLNVFEHTTSDANYEEADVAFIHAEMEANATFIDATIGWAITEACQGRSAPARGSREWLELARALAYAQSEAIARSLEQASIVGRDRARLESVEGLTPRLTSFAPT